MLLSLLTDIPDTIQIALIIVLSLSLGSFCTMLTHRIPAGQSWWKGRARSYCPACKEPIRFFSLIPIFSYLIQKGKCSHCGVPISKTYLLTELAMLVLGFVSYLAVGWTIHLFFILCALPFLLAAIIIDIRLMVLPNRLNLILAAIAILEMLISTLINNDFQIIEVFTSAEIISRISAAFLFCFFAWFVGFLTSFIIGREALGMGDVKFFFVVGLWLGTGNLAIFAILSGFLGILFHCGWSFIMKNKKQKSQAFPFGPALITTLFILLLFDNSQWL